MIAVYVITWRQRIQLCNAVASHKKFIMSGRSLHFVRKIYEDFSIFRQAIALGGVFFMLKNAV
ncbi:hypothetical protein F8S12_17255 [Nostoc sp. WHI]|nr:hypothetical protein [Nostoc sp. WHI]